MERYHEYSRIIWVLDFQTTDVVLKQNLEDDVSKARTIRNYGKRTVNEPKSE